LSEIFLKSSLVALDATTGTPTTLLTFGLQDGPEVCVALAWVVIGGDFTTLERAGAEGKLS